VILSGCVRVPSRESVGGFFYFRRLIPSHVSSIPCAGGKKEGRAAQRASSKTSATSRSRPAFERARRAINDLYAQGVPDQAALPNATLCRRVAQKLKEESLPSVSDDTILRAAGRRN
jgi:hypothetical protein